MPIPYNVAKVLAYFHRSIQAYDIVGTIVDHEVARQKSAVYSFVGVVIPPTNKDLELFDEGELASGSLIVYVPKNVRLYICDAVANIQDGQRQTIVLFDDDEYRVKGISNRASDGLHRKYTMTRYLEGRSNVY